MDDNTINMGYLKIILGSMFAGKTTELIKEYRRHSACELKCCFINSLHDNRYNSGKIVTKTHSQMEITNDYSVKKLEDIFSTNYAIDYDVYFINEGQFFDDLYYWVDWLVNFKDKN